MQLILCKDNANERNENLFSNCRMQLILCKNTTFILFNLIILLVFHFFIRMNIDMDRFSVTLEANDIFNISNHDIQFYSKDVTLW